MITYKYMGQQWTIWVQYSLYRINWKSYLHKYIKIK